MEIKFEEHKNLVLKFCSKYKNSNLYEDFVSLGNIGLLSAIENFNKDIGYQFSTYAYYCIRNSIFEYMRNNKKHLVSSTSLDEVVDELDGLRLLDIIESDFDIFDGIPDDTEIMKVIKKKLSPKEEVVLNLRLSGKTFEDIGNEYNISRQRIGQIFNNIRNKLSYLKPYLKGETNEIPNENKTENSMGL